jgi:UDP-glucose:glycoprotein glucosyltransferase
VRLLSLYNLIGTSIGLLQILYLQVAHALAGGIAEQQLPALSWSIIHATFNTLGTADNSADTANGKVPIVEEALDSARRWTRRLGVSGKDGEGFVNGRWCEVGGNFLRDLQTESVGQMQLLQELVGILYYLFPPDFAIY